MLLKIVIGLLFIANVVALGVALSAMLEDKGRGGKRTANLLFIRAGLGIMLVAAIVFGALTGQLPVVAPWHNG